MIGVHVEHLTKRFVTPSRTVTPVDDLTLDMPAGSITAVIGRSGCGKTTFLRLLSGLEAPDAGKMTFTGESGSAVPRISVVFQEHRLFPWMSVRENVAVAVRHLPPHQRRSKTDAVLALTGLEAAADLMPAELSGGMSQRVGLARALVSEPDVLLLDEAFSALDALTRRQLYDEFIRIYSEHPVTTVLVTHDVAEAVLLSRKVCRLDEGRLVSQYEVPWDYPRTLSTSGLSQLTERILHEFFVH
ncbi:MAG: ATP-binding cassette domain-containing protein [Sutterella sp.]|nr:ATP-binding cassette domain-containing protein [Sutterella sp.]